MDHDRTDLPPELSDRFSRPFARFLKVEAASGAVLLIATVVALILSNTVWHAAFLAFWETPVGFHFGALDFTRSLRHWINDALMTLFFFVIALELKRGFVLGELRNLRMAALSFAGALGGMLVPALIYLFLARGGPELHGWGTVMATDTAFVVGCLALFGSRIPATLRLFLLSLAIFDDIGAILVVAIGYGSAFNWVALALAGLGLVTVFAAARIGIRSIPVYFLLGALIWVCFDASGIHATIAGVFLGLMTPTGGWVSDRRLRAIFDRVLSYPVGDQWSGDTSERHDLRLAGTAAREVLSPVERLELMLHPWMGFMIMPLFALANAGVEISFADIATPASVAIFLALVLGKPLGVVSFCWIAIRLDLAKRAPGLSWSLLIAGGFLTGIGFTMSLFIAGLAFPPAMLDSAKIGILCGSVVSAALGLLALTWSTYRKTDQLDNM